MKYCHDTTVNHPLSIRFPQHVDTINNIIASESKKEKEIQPQPFTKEVGLLLDNVKDEVNNSSNDSYLKGMHSVDMVLGMKNDDSKLSLLVEFKLGCNNPINIKEGECRDKINDSKILLFGSGIPIHNKYIFIFNYKILQEAKRIVSQRLANASGEVLGIEEFKSKYF